MEIDLSEVHAFNFSVSTDFDKPDVAVVEIYPVDLSQEPNDEDLTLRLSWGAAIGIHRALSRWLQQQETRRQRSAAESARVDTGTSTVRIDPDDAIFDDGN